METEESHLQPCRSTRLHSPAYVALLRAGPRLRPLQQAHAHLVVAGAHRTRSLLTKLITLTLSAGSMSYARELFLTVPEPDPFLLNSLITFSSKTGFPNDALFFYCRMVVSNLPPSNYSFTSVIKSCADLSVLSIGRCVHAQALAHGYCSDCFVQSALVAFYCKCGDLVTAREVFDQMPVKSIVAWNSLISGYEQNGYAKEALEVFDAMRCLSMEPDSATFVGVLSACAQLGDLGLGSWIHECVVRNGYELNVVLGTSLINMYARCGDVDKAREVFDSMKEKNVIAWTAMVSAYGTNGHGGSAMELFRQMKAYGPRPNKVTFVAVLTACAHAGLVHEGRQAFWSMKEDYALEPKTEHYVCMVDMLGRAGLLSEAYSFVRDSIPGNLPPPAVWTAMLGACKMHKDLDLGVRVAEHLLETEPDNPGHYVMLSNIYALAGMTDRVQLIRNLMIHRGLKKQVGYSTIEVDGRTYMFSMGDKCHPETGQIYEFLDELMSKCREKGYTAVGDSLMHELEGEERDHALSVTNAVPFGAVS
ncbi:hypothetical protein SAY86_012118 [Trapa natans]|uniref:Pentatricopeptide repeat-containing protein n=1 Tax=Trapa natans TaxID=22666 RepID=A0AAN7LXH7_TRANT|nr:hypothetical protein SAY86_012118 [Trapa natans]